MYPTAKYYQCRRKGVRHQHPSKQLMSDLGVTAKVYRTTGKQGKITPNRQLRRELRKLGVRT